MRRSLWALSGLLMACEPDMAGVVSNGQAVDHEIVGVALFGPTSDAPDTLLVRAVDADLTSAGPAVVTALIGGEPVEVDVDPRGYGSLSIAVRGAVSLGGLGQDRAVVHDQPWATEWGLAHAPLPEVGPIEPAGRGALVGSGAEVWWVGPGLPPHVVGRLGGGTPAQVRALPIDDDGVIDAVAWAGEQVLLLRGREEGGASFGARIVAPGWEARGADVRDFDGDGRRDLVIAWAAEGQGILQVWAGDGAWSFSPIIERSIASAPVDVAAARDRGDLLTIATALTEDGGWQRLLRADAETWRLTGPPLSFDAGAGSTIRSGGDYDGSGADNLVVVPPRVDGAPREAAIWSLDADPPRFVRAAFVGGHLAFGDLEGDGRPNVLGLDQTRSILSYVGWVDGQATSREAGALDRFGPIGLGSIDDRAEPDLLVASELLTWFRGVDDRDEVSRWRPARPGGASFPLGLDGPIAASDDGQVIAVTRQGDTLRVSVLRFDGLAPAAEDPVAIGSFESPVRELVHCGHGAWALTDTEAILIDVTLRVSGRRALVAPRGLACVNGPGFATAVVIDEGQAVLLGAAGAVVDRVPLTQTGGVAVLGEGDDARVVGCAGPCVAVSAPGGDVLAVSTAQGLNIQGPFGERSFVADDPRPFAVDLDGDGQAEILWRWGHQLVGIARLVDGELAEPVWLHVDGVDPGAPIAAGLAGGPRDLWFRQGQRLRGARLP